MDLASAEAEIRHVFGDTPITEASIGAAPPDILVKLSDFKFGVFRLLTSKYDEKTREQVDKFRATERTPEIESFLGGEGAYALPQEFHTFSACLSLSFISQAMPLILRKVYLI